MEGFSAALAAGNAWLLLPGAVVLGVLHALEPGHAKGMMAGFIIGTRGTPLQALVLGLSAAIAHSLVVWGLVLGALALGFAAVPPHWLPWLALLAGLVALSFAGWMAWRLLRPAPNHHDHHHHDDHHDGQDHHHHDGHQHAPPPSGPVGMREVVAFGFSGGLVPCPAALAVLALCLQAGAATLGVAMVAAFSLGLALVMVSVGLAASLGQGLFGSGSTIARVLPWLSVAVMAGSGLYTVLRAVLRHA